MQFASRKNRVCRRVRPLRGASVAAPATPIKAARPGGSRYNWIGFCSCESRPSTIAGTRVFPSRPRDFPARARYHCFLIFEECHFSFHREPHVSTLASLDLFLSCNSAKESRERCPRGYRRHNRRDSFQIFTKISNRYQRSVK